MKKRTNHRIQLKHQLFLHSKSWLAAAIISIIILSAYNIVISWILQKIIDIAAGNDPTPLTSILLLAIASYAVFMAAYFIYRTARPKFIQTAMTQYKANVFEKVLSKKIGSMSDENTSRLISALTNDMKTVEDYRRGDDVRSSADILAERLRWCFQTEKLGDIVKKGTDEPLVFIQYYFEIPCFAEGYYWRQGGL